MKIWSKISSPKFCAAPFERHCSDFFGRYSRFVARHPYGFIIFPILLTSLLSTGIFFRFKVVRGVHYLYSPLNAEWKTEQEVFQKYWTSNDDNFYPGKDAILRKGFYVIVTAHDGGDVLRPQLAVEFSKFIQWITTVGYRAYDDRFYTFRDICLKFQNQCFVNDQIRFLAEIFAKQDQVLLNLTYPLFASNFMAEPIDLSNVLGGVKLLNNGIVGTAKAWMVGYQFRQTPDSINQIRHDFWLFLSDQIRQRNVSTPNLNIYYYHSDTLDIELGENAKRLAPRFAVTFAILILFALFCTFHFLWIPLYSTMNFPVVDWISSKPILGFTAIVSSIGLLLWLEVTFVDMCSVMPFLSLTIGIDDTFLMLASWHGTNRKLAVEDRVEQAMRHAAVSITITSLTDSLAFLIGAIAPLPAVTYFCFYSSVAIFFIYLYFMTIFVAVLSILGKWEYEQRNSLFYCKTLDSENYVFNVGRYLDKGRGVVEKFDSNKHENEFWYQNFFQKIYVPFISHPSIQVLALLSYAGYIFITVVGINNLVIGFDLINIVTYDSPSRQFLQLRAEYFPEDVSRLDLATLNPPNMGNITERNLFLNALSELENSHCATGRNFTGFWFFEWQKYLANMGFPDSIGDLNESSKEFYEDLLGFLMSNEKFKHDLLYSKNGTLDAFRLTINLKNFSSDENILKCAKKIRYLCKKYSQFDLYSYSPLWNLADQYEIIWPQTMQDLYISVGVMIVIALLAIPQPLCSIAIALNILSIGFGVIGFMSYATSMITIAMSVGFSVDFAAHVTYAYTKADLNGLKPKERLGEALSSVGWPITQASVSVILGISTLATVPTYIVQTCFKTIMLVIVFGMLHALLYLPSFLMNFHKLFHFISNKINQR